MAICAIFSGTCPSYRIYWLSSTFQESRKIIFKHQIICTLHHCEINPEVQQNSQFHLRIEAVSFFLFIQLMSLSIGQSNKLPKSIRTKCEKYVYRTLNQTIIREYWFIVNVFVRVTGLLVGTESNKKIN